MNRDNSTHNHRFLIAHNQKADILPSDKDICN